MQVVGGRRPDPCKRPRGQVTELLGPWLPTGLFRAQRAEVLPTSGRGAHSRGPLLCLPVSCVGVRADTGGSLGGGDASSTFQAGSRGAVLLSLFAVPPGKLWAAHADISWEERAGRREDTLASWSSNCRWTEPPGWRGTLSVCRSQGPHLATERSHVLCVGQWCSAGQEDLIPALKQLTAYREHSSNRYEWVSSLSSRTMLFSVVTVLSIFMY